MARAALDIADEIMSFDEAATDAVADDDDDREAPYLPVGEMSIPVPKSFGKCWQKKIEDTIKANEVETMIWDRCFELYRQCGNEGAKLNDAEYRYRLSNDVDENIIRTNIRSIMRSTYMQNPHIEFTDTKPNSRLAETIEYILQFIMNKQSYPGINMKPKARRWILHGQLTNFGVLRLDYQPHDGSQQQAVEELKKLEGELEKATTKDEIKAIYAKLEILHNELPLSQQKGMHLFNVLPQCLIVDPESTYFDLSDAKWVAEWYDEDRDFVHNKWYQKDEEGVWRLRSNPDITAVVEDEPEKSTADIVAEKVLNHRSEEQRELIAKNKVRLYYVYDKILRRIYLFNSENWKYPLWVAEDDMLLSRFFRHFILSFGEPIDSVVQPGEVSFYVGQVNEVNRINRKAKRIRDSIFGALVYNSKNVDKKEVEKLVRHLENPDEVKAFGVGVDAEKSINEVLEVLAPPAFQFKEAFDSTLLRQTIDRQAAISEVDRGQQFKTNTTNKQVEYYSHNRQETTMVLIDSIEDSFEALGWSMAELLVSKYDKKDIAEMIGEERAQFFEQLSVPEFNHRYRMAIAAGSIEKPTSEYKKQEAMHIANALGQIGQAAPATTMRLMLRMFEQAFSNFSVTKEEWDMLGQEAIANLQKGISTNDQGTAPVNPQ